MRLSSIFFAAIVVLTAGASAQSTPAAPAAQKTPAAAPTAPPLQLQSLDPAARPDPFPPVNPKYFTADSPSVATVDAYLRVMVGYDPGRLWRVAAIEKTPAAGVAHVTVFLTDRTPNAKVNTASFFVMPDGKHIIADLQALQPFGVHPFADYRAMLDARADGPSHGATTKDLMLVEFADLQCPHCKDAQPIMARLAQDFPKARIVYESFPLTNLHPLAFKAAAYGVCVSKKNSDAFFTFIQAVYDTQGALTPDDGEQTLKNAATKAGVDPEATATCAAGADAKASVDASTKLATDLGINETPTLMVNGRPLPFTSIPYETLKQIIAFQAAQ